MLKATIDKIKTKLCDWEYGCSCCMSKKDKPKIRRIVRRKLKTELKQEVREL